MATNDMAESPFAGLTQQIQQFGRLLGIHASGIGQARINGDLKRLLDGCDPMLKEGLYHCLPIKMRQSLMAYALGAAPTVRANEEKALNKQRQHKQNKQAMLKRHKLLGCQQAYANALTYIEMFHSPAGWQTKAIALAEFEKLTSKSSKLDAVKDQIRIRVLGFGWDDLHHAWSTKGVDRTPEDLLLYLTDVIIPEQTERGIPNKPKITLPSRGDKRATLGTMARDIVLLDKNHKANETVFVAEATAMQDKLETDGIIDRHEKLQPRTQPIINEGYVGTQIEQIWEFLEDDGTSKLIWCKGLVIGVLNKKTKVRIQWDKEYHREGDPEISQEPFMVSKWNKHVERGWRLALD